MVQIGLSDFHYAILTDDPIGGSAAYENPVKVPGIISAGINPNAALETLYADDGPSEVATSLGNIEFTLSMKDLDLETQAALLGHTVSNGVLIKKSTDVPPWVAVGFKSQKANGKYRYVWLLKGKFAQPQTNYQTKGETVEFQPPEISATFAKRDSDNMWQRIGDEDAPNWPAGLSDTWFTSPDESGGV